MSSVTSASEVNRDSDVLFLTSVESVLCKLYLFLIYFTVKVFYCCRLFWVLGDIIVLMSFKFIVLGDFGIAKSLEDSLEVAKTCVGTPCYLSPEMCQDVPYSSKADIWVRVLTCLKYSVYTCSNLLEITDKA